MFDFPEFTPQIEAIHSNGGLRVTGELNGLATLAYADHDVEKAIEVCEWDVCPDTFRVLLK